MRAAVAPAGRAFTSGSVVALGIGLALYQLTTMALGPVTSRELHVALSIPSVEMPQLSEPAISDVHLVIGTHVDPMPVPANRQTLGSLPAVVVRQAMAHAGAAPSALVEPTGPMLHLTPPVTIPTPEAIDRAPGIKDGAESHYHDGDEGSL